MLAKSVAVATNREDRKVHSRVIKDQRPGLTIERFFTRQGVDPFETVEWELRDAVISGADGKVVFEQRGVEFPKTWSQTATNVVVQKYFRGTLGTPNREASVRSMIARVADTIYGWGKTDGYFKSEQDAWAFRDELVHLLLHQKMAFNSPVWFNVGVEDYPQCSACFINSVDDSMGSILTLAKTEGMLFKYGSGTGSNLSSLRSSREHLNGGGTASGPVSFMRGFDAFAGAIKSGGKTRRAAKMVILNIDHPDVVDFIDCKAIEEKKAWALIDAGYDGGFNVVGGAYDSVNYQNANHSVRVTDDFMNAVLRDGDWHTRGVTDGKKLDGYRARELMRKMADAAWICGDPGIQYDTTINDWHPCINTSRINASNPCSEYMFLDDSACNLASLNLRKFQRQGSTSGELAGEFDCDSFKRAVQTTITAMEIIVDNSSYPTQQIGENSYKFRPLGLGFANLGALLMSRSLPYDSEPGRAYAGAITALMCGEAYKTSARIAADATGPFAGYADNETPFLRVMRKHRSACDRIDSAFVPYDLMQAAKESWDGAIDLGQKYGFRNGQTTVLAPTGTIAFLMDCDTTGVEPDIAIVKYKRLVGGGLLKIVNNTVPEALGKLGYDDKEVEAIVSHIDDNDTIEGAPGLEDEDLPVFDCAFRSSNGSRSIHYMGHIRMMAAVQPFLSGAISKTVNLPNDCTVEDIEDAYIQAWKMGLKAIAVYRDGCKRTQPLSTNMKQATSDGSKVASLETIGAANIDPLALLPADERRLVEALRIRKTRPAGPPMATRYKLPDERASFTHKFSIGGHEGYITVGLYEDHSPGEIFVRMAKEGSVIAGLMDSFATAISLALQHGVPVNVLIEKFKGTRFEPSGFTGNQEIPIATSIMDYLFRWLAIRFPSEGPSMVDRHPAARNSQLDLPKVPLLSKDFVSVEVKAASPSIPVEVVDQTPSRAWVQETDAPPCHECGTLMVRNGACHKCPNCGSTSGCS
ncbi:MAG: vitamin B12-dependent ribonucleotide reductase [Kofleriaceae bacterium]